MEDHGFMKFLEEKKKLVDDKIREYFPERMDEAYIRSLSGGSQYEHDLRALNKSISEPIWDFLKRGGKRWRPGLFLLITEALSGDTKKVEDFAILPEMIHNGSIMVDDIEDDGKTRRGKPCTHRIYGTDIAINAGNFMYFLPLLVFIKNRESFDEKTLTRAYGAYAQELITIHLGQATDIHWHKGGSENITESQYLQMCAYKTGCLARLSARLAVILSGGSREQEEKIGRIGESIGIAFQIRDDVLSVVGEDFSKKKGYGDDITEGKRSLPVIYTLGAARLEDRKRLLEILGMHTTEPALIKEAIEILKKYKSTEYALGVANKIVADTWRDADPLLPDTEAKKKIKLFIDYMIEREM